MVVGSGQTDIKQTATQGWKAENAQRRMDSLLTSTYNGEDPGRRLSPNDTLARAIITSVKGAGKPPGRHRAGLRGRVGQVDHGGRAVLDDQQGHPQPGPETINMVKALQAGRSRRSTTPSPTTTASRSSRPYLLPPVIVTKENAAEAYANDPTLSKLTG